MDGISEDVRTNGFALIQAEYEAAASTLSPTSRSQLARHLSAKTKVSYKIAVQVVEAYCEEHSVALPEYLGKEFNVGWLKVVSVAMAAVAVAICIYSRDQHFQNKSPVISWVLAVMFLGLAVLSWIKSLEEEVHISRNSKK